MAARPSVASMAPYISRSFFGTGQLEAPLHPRQLGKQREFGILDLARYILTFADRKMHRAMSVVNRSWKHLAAPFCQLPYLVSERGTLLRGEPRLGGVDKLKLNTLAPDSRERLLFHIAQGILQLLHEMHSRDRCYLNLKPANFAVTQEGRVVVIDFDCAVKMTRGAVDLREHDGDEDTYSPERWLAGRFPGRRVCAGDKVDIWTAGLSLLALSGVDATAFFGKSALRPLVMGGTPDAALGRYVGETLKRLPAFFTPARDSLAHLLLHLLNPDPNRRSTAAIALCHPWLTIMAAHTALHRDKVIGYLREFVQDEQLHIRATPKTKGTFDAPHFTSFVARPAIQTTLDRKVFATISYTTAAPLIVCQGAEGLGKTTLLANLFHSPDTRSHFGLRLWFYESDCPKKIQAQFVVLARELMLVDEQTPPEEAIRRLQSYLSTYPQRFGKPWVAVFDDADTPESLRPLLPSSGGHILVSTRTAWPDSIAIGVLTESEGQALVSKLLLRDDPQSPELCRALDYHPLGLMHACAYIRNHRLSLPAFLEELSKSTKAVSADERLLSRSLPSSVSGLWKMIFEELRAQSPGAMAQLELYAYLAPERLPQLNDFSEPTDDFSEATTALLKEYSLLQGREQLSIHRFLQMILRAAHPVERQVAIVGRAMELLRSALDRGFTSEAEKHNRDLAPHGEMLHGHYERLTGLLGSERVVEPLHAPWVDMMLWMDEVQESTASALARRSMLEKTLAIAVRLYGPEHVRIAAIKTRIGYALYNLKEYRQAIDYLEQALAIERRALAPEHPHVAFYWNNIGIAWEALGEHRRAIECHQQALAIYGETLDAGNSLVAASLNNLGIAWNALGEPRRALECYKQALAIKRKVL